MTISKTKRPGRKVKATRQIYTLELKSKAKAWKQHDGMSLKEIKKKLKNDYGIDIAMSTLSTWWA